MKMRERKEENGREMNKTLRRGSCPKRKGGENERKKIVVMCLGVNECKRRKKGARGMKGKERGRGLLIETDASRAGRIGRKGREKSIKEEERKEEENVCVVCVVCVCVCV
jgi:hypothetical protein